MRSILLHSTLLVGGGTELPSAKYCQTRRQERYFAGSAHGVGLAEPEKERHARNIPSHPARVCHDPSPKAGWPAYAH
jgi:hypothetical protein